MPLTSVVMPEAASQILFFVDARTTGMLNCSSQRFKTALKFCRIFHNCNLLWSSEISLNAQQLQAMCSNFTRWTATSRDGYSNFTRWIAT